MKTAFLLCSVVAYLLITDWITDPWSTNLAFAAIFALTAGIALRALRGNFNLRAPWTLLPLASAALWGLLQLAAGIPAYRFETWISILKWTAALALFWTALQTVSSDRLSSPIKDGFVALGAALSLEAILQFYSGTTRIYGLFAVDEQTHPMGPFRNRDHFCALMELILPIALWNGVRDRRRSWIYFTAAAVMYAGIIASASRAGAIISTAEILLVVVAAVGRRRENARVSLAIVAAVVMLAGGAIVGWSPLLERFQTQHLFLYRREFFVSTLQMIQNHPLFGSGLGSWRWVYPSYALIDAQAVANHAHCDWLEWASDGGILFAGFLGVPAFRAFWLSLTRPWGFGIVAVFAHAAVDFPLQRAPLLFASLLLLALLEARSQQATATSR